MAASSLEGLAVGSSVCLTIGLVVVPMSSCSAVVVPGTSM